MRASSKSFLSNTRSHVHGIGKIYRKGKMCGCATCRQIQEEEEEKEEIRCKTKSQIVKLVPVSGGTAKSLSRPRPTPPPPPLPPPPPPTTTTTMPTTTTTTTKTKTPRNSFGENCHLSRKKGNFATKSGSASTNFYDLPFLFKFFCNFLRNLPFFADDPDSGKRQVVAWRPRSILLVLKISEVPEFQIIELI